jgi:ribosomal protein S18 acetylase RimI-like enzyme
VSTAHGTEVRAARPDDLALIADIERAAGALFVDAGMPEIAQHPPTPLDDLRAHADDHTLLITTDHGVVVGFATVILLAEHAHLDQMAVHPAYGRRGHGTRLLEAACALARERGSTYVTLTTFERIPWNAPYYAQRGFCVLTEDELTQDLHERRQLEATYGLDPALRVIMRRKL